MKALCIPYLLTNCFSEPALGSRGYLWLWKPSGAVISSPRGMKPSPSEGELQSYSCVMTNALLAYAGPFLGR